MNMLSNHTAKAKAKDDQKRANIQIIEYEKHLTKGKSEVGRAIVPTPPHISHVLFALVSLSNAGGGVAKWWCGIGWTVYY